MIPDQSVQIITFGDYELRVADTTTTFDAQSLQSSPEHGTMNFLGERRPGEINVVNITTCLLKQERWRLSLGAQDYTYYRYPHRVACFDLFVWVAVGRFIVALEIDTGQVLWSLLCDSTFCKGIYPLLNEAGLIVAGNEITRLSVDGKIIWQAAVEDGFMTCVLEPTRIRATDHAFNEFSIRLDTGQATMTERVDWFWDWT